MTLNSYRGTPDGVSVARNHLTPLARNHEGQGPARSAGREKPDGAVAHEEVGSARVETVEAAALQVAAVDKARPRRDRAADKVAVERRAVRPVLPVEPVPPAGPRVAACRNDLAFRVIGV